MKNVTLSLDDTLAEWARVEAAREAKSLSRFLSELVEERRRRDPAYRRAMESLFSRGPVDLGLNGRAPSRESLYDRPILRGHEPPGLQEGPVEPFETGES